MTGTPVTVIYYDGNHTQAGWALWLGGESDPEYQPTIFPMGLKSSDPPHYITQEEMDNEEFSVSALIRGLHDIDWISI